MDRRTALAISASLMATVVVGGIAFAALGGIDVLGFGSEQQADSVDLVETTPTTTEMSVTVLSVDTTTTLAGEVPPAATTPGATPGPTSGPAAGATSPAGPGTTAAPGTTAPRATTPGATTPPTSPATVAPTSPPTVAPTTPPTTPRTTVPPATTAPPTASTLPAGVPSDWPPGKPIPPKPVGCVNGQLEDNGVWNCQH